MKYTCKSIHKLQISPWQWLQMIFKLEQLRDNASHLIIHLLREQLSRGTSQHEKYLQKVNPGMSTWLLTRYSQPSQFTNEYFFRNSHSQTTTTTTSNLYLTCLKILWNWSSPVTITQTCYWQIITNLSHLPIMNIYNCTQSPHKVHACTSLEPVQHVLMRVSVGLREKSRESIARHPTAIIGTMVWTAHAYRFIGMIVGQGLFRLAIVNIYGC